MSVLKGGFSVVDSCISQFMGKRIKLHLSTWARLFGGVVGVVTNYKDGWIELKNKGNAEYIRADKVISFKVLE
jgi:hypothetical protein